LDVGVLFKDADSFNKVYIKTVQKLCEEFKLPVNLPFFCSTHLKKEIGIKKAIPFCDKLVAEVQDYIDLIHISYIILPPAIVPTVMSEGKTLLKKRSILLTFCAIYLQCSHISVRGIS